MGFIGNRPADTFHTTVKQSFTADSSTTSFTLNQSVAGENEIELFINNVRPVSYTHLTLPTSG